MSGHTYFGFLPSSENSPARQMPRPTPAATPRMQPTLAGKGATLMARAAVLSPPSVLPRLSWASEMQAAALRPAGNMGAIILELTQLKVMLID